MIDERGVSSALTYALIVAITTTLVVGLVLGTDSLVQSNRERAATEQLEVVEQRLATALETAHRLSRTDSDETRPEQLTLTRQFPRRLARSQYRVSVVALGANDYSLRLELVDTGVSTVTEIRLAQAPRVAETTVNGGPLEVVYVTDPPPSSPDPRLVIRSA